ncbi:MAG: hypothetical protein M1338_00365 [Patescibacteria group bacterium]|nr:hypothetical protein [Patescibacteria group bacterium]
MKKTVLLIYVLAFAVSFMLASHARAQAYDTWTTQPGRNGNSVGSGGSDFGSINTVRLSAIAGNLNLEWYVGQTNPGPNMAWHHYEVRYSVVNGKDGGINENQAACLNPDAGGGCVDDKAPFLYKGPDSYPSMPAGSPSYNLAALPCDGVSGQCINYTAVFPQVNPNPGSYDNTLLYNVNGEPRGEPRPAYNAWHNANNINLTNLRGKIVRFQIVEWWWMFGTSFGSQEGFAGGSGASVSGRPYGWRGAIAAVTPPVVVDDLRPGAQVTFSNTDVLNGSSDVTQSSYYPAYSSIADGGNAYLNINREVITGEEYLLHVVTSVDSQGNLINITSNNVDFQRTGRDLDGLNSVTEYSELQKPNAMPNSDIGVLFLPRRLDGKDTTTYYEARYKKEYSNLFANADNYTNYASQPIIANLSSGSGSLTYTNTSGAPDAGSISNLTTAQASTLDQINKFQLSIDITLTNKRPQLSMRALSCTPQADKQEGNRVELKTFDTVSKNYVCNFELTNGNLGTRVFKIAPNKPISDQVFDFSGYPAGSSINPGGSGITFPVVVNSQNLNFPDNLCEVADKKEFTVESAPIPSIPSIRGGDIFKIATDSGVDLQPYNLSKSADQINQEKNIFISQYNNEIVGKEQAGVDRDNAACFGDACRIGELDLYKLPQVLGCDLSCPSSAKINGLIPLVWGVNGLESPIISLTKDEYVNGDKRIVGIGGNIDLKTAKTYTDTAPATLPPNNQIVRSLNVADTHCRNASCHCVVPIISSDSQAFQAVFIANGSVNITRTDPLTIKYDTRFLNSVPPGFGDLLAPLWKEK